MDIGLKKSIIVYFDILGYKENIKKFGDKRYLLDIECAIRNVLIELKLLGKEWDVGECYIDERNEITRRYNSVEYRIFSDNIVIAVSLFNEAEKNFRLIRTIIPYVVRIQQNLINMYQTFIRGSMVIGDIYFSKNYVFGSGLIKAYEIENDIAIFPRIVLDEDCVQMFRGYNVNQHIKDLCKVVDEQIMEDIDGNIFINYLPIDYRYVERIGADIITIEAINTHKMVIEIFIETTKQPKILQKYNWCKNFHNTICERYKLQRYKIE